MSKRAAIVIAVIALAIGLFAGRFLLSRPPSPVASNPGGQSASDDDAAASASRAMTFTQPKAPTK
ncbi:hypothetical protein JQ593_18680 [Bradyrhizobium viridifuturi]|uniref:hypothetical protein n=1 Tax=uncultured Bradyrhizobium sp. TaxID=199684 RepID=UPI001BAA6DD1|nr:hypothetical protein [uncultured Bradyrhizobium sp.]MBR1041122.1 hypothetical protein [Bradyrhizobium viridifuturi]MBR1075118.1 hypothetical protein [Bradyrhizobium viridifuturi]